MRRTVLTATLIAAAFTLAACGGTDDTSSDTPPATSGTSSLATSTAPPQDTPEATPDTIADVKIVKQGVEDHRVWGSDAYVIYYEITNNGDEAADYFASIEFLDADGDHLGSTGVLAQKLGPGKVSEGDAAPLEAEITNGSLSDIRSARVENVERTPVDSQ